MSAEEMAVQLTASRVFNQPLLLRVRGIPKTTWVRLASNAFKALTFISQFDELMLRRCQAETNIRREIRLQRVRCDVLKFSLTVLLEEASYGELWVNCSCGPALIVAFNPGEVFTGLDRAAAKKLMAGA